VNDFVLSLLPELGTMGSKRGGVGETRSSTSYAVWLYYRINLSHRDIEDLLAERGITVSREAIRLWCIKFGAIYTRRLKRKHGGYGEPRKIVTDKLRSYAVAHRELIPEAIHDTSQYANNRVEQSHEATRE
jgi:transposase-like protein